MSSRRSHLPTNLNRLFLLLVLSPYLVLTQPTSSNPSIRPLPRLLIKRQDLSFLTPRQAPTAGSGLQPSSPEGSGTRSTETTPSTSSPSHSNPSTPNTATTGSNTSPSTGGSSTSSSAGSNTSPSPSGGILGTGDSPLTGPSPATSPSSPSSASPASATQSSTSSPSIVPISPAATPVTSSGTALPAAQTSASAVSNISNNDRQSQSSSVPQSPATSAPKTTSASGVSSAPAQQAQRDESSSFGATTLKTIGIIAGVVAGLFMLWTIIRKWKFSPSRRFARKLEYDDEVFAPRPPSFAEKRPNDYDSYHNTPVLDHKGSPHQVNLPGTAYGGHSSSELKHMEMESIAFTIQQPVNSAYHSHSRPFSPVSSPAPAMFRPASQHTEHAQSTAARSSHAYPPSEGRSSFDLKNHEHIKRFL